MKADWVSFSVFGLFDLMKEGDPGDVLLVVLVEASSEGQSSDISELIVLLAVLEAFRSRHRVAFEN